MYNLSADLAKNLKQMETYTDSRTAVQSPTKPDYPMVWDMYMDSNVLAQNPLSSASPDTDILGAMNDRLKTQSRRYPHPITNEMEDFH